MGRPRIEWTDTQLSEIRSALPALDEDTRQDNARFLDGLVALVRATTGRLYGATTYGKLLRALAPQTGIERRPSSATVQAAVLRAQALDTQPAAKRVNRRQGTLDGTPDRTPDRRQTAPDDAQQLRVAQALLADAHTRIRRLEQESAELRRALGQAEAARDLAGRHVNAMLEELYVAIAGRRPPRREARRRQDPAS